MISFFHECITMHRYILFIAVFIFCTACTGNSPSSSDSSTSLYVEGDILSTEDQQLDFNYCYPHSLVGDSFSFADNMGKIFMIEMSATW